jgi:hypothetical protein
MHIFYQDTANTELYAAFPELGLPVRAKREKRVAAADRVFPAMRKWGSPLLR